MKDLLYSEDNSFFIDGLKISGVQSVNGSYNISSQDNVFLGYAGDPEFIQNAPASASFSFERALMSSDEPITNLIADTGFNGGIEYNGRVLNFTSGYLDSYSVNFSIDSLPQSSINISVYGEMGPHVSSQTPKPNQTEFIIPTSSGISLTCDGRETNRVRNFSFSINPSREPIYKIGSIFPCEVAFMTPISNSFSVEIDVDDYETRNLYDYIRTGIHTKNIEVVVKDQCDQSKSITYDFKKFNLIGENFSTDSENNTTVRLDYAMNSHSPPQITYT
tara:strand:+ start:573 stop:1400 length:828 start_codon:yes stop_codon:yes gene_type:complete